MPIDVNRPDLIIGVVGAGTMGRGIAQIAGVAGCSVILADSRPGAASEAHSFVTRIFRRQVEKGALAQDQANAALARIKVVDHIDGLSSCHVVIEAIAEVLSEKKNLMRQLETVVSEACLLATNTSSLSVTSIAAACRIPGRIGGFHFFNPVPLMKIVEVVDGEVTEPWVGDALVVLARRMGHRPFRVKDTPGFIVNHAGRGFAPESLKLVGEGVADFAEVDRILKGAAGFRMGPFELIDLIGLDISHTAMESIYEQYYQEPRYRPSPIGRQRMAAGLLGRKVGRGFYRYDGDRAIVPPVPSPQIAWSGPVWVAPDDSATKIVDIVSRLGAEVRDDDHPGEDALCVVAPVGEDCTTAALRHGLDPRRTIAIDPLFGLQTHRTLMTNPATVHGMRDGAHGLFASDGVPVTVIHDSPGFVAQRVVATIVNIACDIAQQRIAIPGDIDEAVVLGLGYPSGPLAWGDRLGASTVLAVLEAMLGLTGDPRYRPSPWLRRRARLGVSLLSPEN